MSRKRNRKHRSWSRRWDYDSATDRYTLHAEQLANLVIGTELKRHAAAKRRNTIERLRSQGRSVADIVILTGISRAAVYRLMAKSAHDPLLD